MKGWTGAKKNRKWLFLKLFKLQICSSVKTSFFVLFEIKFNYKAFEFSDN